jgi:hypothetical protein
MISEYLDGEEKLIRTYSTAKYENGVVSTKTFKTQEIDTNGGITTTYTKPRRSDKNSFNNENCDDTRKHPVCESSGKDTATLTETATQKLSILTDKTNTSPFTETENQTETRSYSEPAKENSVNKKPLTKVPQQRQAIMAGGAGTALLVSSIASHALKMHIIAVVGGIVGLACMSFALYNVLKPSTKLEEVKDVECSRKSPEVAL